jgi:hypothetical protein
MAVRLAALLPRLLIVALVWVLLSGTLTYAAARRIEHHAAAKASAPATAPTLVVPDVRGQAFTFAKGILEDNGFAWRVTGSVHGYATNVVVAQQPAPGTRVIDTGAPALMLTLARGHYAQVGAPEDTPSYRGTEIRLPGQAPAVVKRAVPKMKPHHAAPTRHLQKRAHKARAHVQAHKRLRARPRAFAVPGAKKEPLNEIPLTVRAARLSAWLTPSRRRTDANVSYWLYQHAWIVTGARFGWWHGAQALRTLIAVDKRVEAQWGFGARSEAVARGALAYVEARSR